MVVSFYLYLKDIIKKVKTVLISDISPLWICPNAMKTHENCIFCKCNKCYNNPVKDTKNDVNDTRRSRRSIRCVQALNAKEGMAIVKLQRQTTAKTIVECNHEILQCFTDYTYFGKEYLKRRTKKGHKLPIKCSSCLSLIVDRIE